MDMKNGDIALGGCNDIYILDNETFTIKQTFNAESRYEYVMDMQSYFNPITG